MRKVFRCLACSLFLGFLLFLSVLAGLTLHYRGGFPVNTWINGIYCTGRTVEQVSEELAARETETVFIVTDADRVSESIAMSAADIYPDFDGVLREYLERQAPSGWLNSLLGAADSELSAGKYGWNEEKLRQAFWSLGFVKKELAREGGVRICYEEGEGYCLEDGNANRLDMEKAYAYLKSCLSRGETKIDLAAAECYLDREDSSGDREQRELWRKISDFAHINIVYDMGAEIIPLTDSVMYGFLKKREADGSVLLDEKGNLIVDEAAVSDWVKQLAAAYDTCGTERKFAATNGGIVTVKYGTYGTRLNVEAEVKYLLNAVRADRGEVHPVETQVHVPSYRQRGYARGLDDIGGTYIEIDMTAQHMYLYLDGELALDAPVVTGDVARRRETPEGIYYVYGKQRDRVLRGADYAAPVKYWMPVVRGVGIHDAGWRNAFGGEIYKTDGSHGCINMPPDIAARLYDAIEVGVPVVMFYNK